jgi:sialate O-acetylesterase
MARSFFNGTAAALVLAAGLIGGNAMAQGRAPAFAHIFADHAVLQQGAPIPIWGTATPSQALTVSLNGQSVAVTTDAKGQWRTTLPVMGAGGPYTLIVATADTKTTLSDIMIGDVFLCSGQSNMEFPARLSTDAWGAIAASANTNIRFVIIAQDSEALPQGDLKAPAKWQVAAADTTGEASAVCYYMAKTLQASHGGAVGMIDSYWGGTTIQSWISPASLETLPGYKAGVATVRAYGAAPEKAEADLGKTQETWWDTHDPDAKAERAYIAPAFDDSKWPTVSPAGSWKDSGITGFKAFDGVAWFRTTVTLTDAQAKTANELVLSSIDTYDTTWVNGQRVGASGVNWLWRDYKVATGVFKPGKNVIVVRVLGGGGLTGQPANRAIKTADGQSIPLTQPWTYKISRPMKGQSIPPAPWYIPNSYNTLYNGMIAPLSGYSVKLAAWYQGESNANNLDQAREYNTLLPLLIKDWRGAFQRPDLPFFVVELANYGTPPVKPGESAWAEIRQAQAQTVRNDPHAGLAVTVDVGDPTNIHPTEKVVVGQRLARAAEAVAYGKAVTPGGPDATGITRSGSDLVIAFKDTNGGLRTYSSDTAIGFETCRGEACTYAPATVAGDTIVLKGANTPDVKRVRYAWADAPFVNLYSADNLPAVPFEMDVK